MARKDLHVLYAHNCGEGEEGYWAREADAVMDKYEDEIRNLRYERLIFKAQYVRSQISSGTYYAWIESGYVKPMPHEEWVNRLCAIAETLEARARKLKEEL